MSLIQRLYELQEAHGYLTDESLRALARRDNVPLYRLQELVSFYPHFRTTPPPRVELAVCRDMSCWLAGGPQRSTRLHEELAGVPGVATQEVSCLGRCEMAPAAALNGKPLSLAGDAPLRIWAETPGSLPRIPSAEVPRWRCDPYADPGERYGTYCNLLQQDRQLAAERVLAALKESNLRGMGGAGFPTAAKWDLVRKENRTPKYVICNADESEPGTFKDRVILADLPHLVIEGMLLAALVTGAEQGILYIRHEYGPERQAFDRALADVRQRGLLDAGITLDVFVSPGGYILGEETALLEALEDKRGEPRNKPPFPGTHGLHGQPTVINNVETLAMVPAVVQRGPAWWKEQGRAGFAGLKFIALSGHIEKPGVYEVPSGTTVRELIALGGGVLGGRPLLAFAPGGASSNFLPASRVDVPLDFAALQEAGSMLGSGAVVVVAEGTDLLALATNVVRFFRNESCGKCVPCRLGSQKAVELLERVQSGTRDRRELAVLPALGETLQLTSICGLGQVALNPILSVLQHWPELAAASE